MPDANTSHRQIIRASAIIGSASVINIVIGLARSKALALLLGPAGLGVAALLTTIVSTAGLLAGLGIATPAVRELAEAHAHGDDARLAAIRTALARLTAVLAVAGAVAFALASRPIARLSLDGGSVPVGFAWLSLGVALTVIAASQLALINGYRLLGRIARLQVFSAIIGTLIGLSALAIWHEEGIVAFVIAAPLGTVVVGIWAARALPHAGAAAPAPELRRIAGSLARSGANFMLANVAALVGLLVLRIVILSRLGPEAQGNFSAAWMISMTYIGFVLQAMGTDYLPRLAATIDDHEKTNRMINEQMDVALTLAAPVLIAMQALAPWIVRTLYSSEFADAVEPLRWQILGDLLKILSWPLGYVLIAASLARTFLATEALAMAVLVGFASLTLDRIGLEATGLGFLLAYVVYLAAVYALARRRSGFRFASRVIRLGCAVFAAVAVVLIVARVDQRAGGIVGVALAVASAAHAVAYLGRLQALPGPIDRLIASLVRR